MKLTKTEQRILDVIKIGGTFTFPAREGRTQDAITKLLEKKLITVERCEEMKYCFIAKAIVN